MFRLWHIKAATFSSVLRASWNHFFLLLQTVPGLMMTCLGDPFVLIIDSNHLLFMSFRQFWCNGKYMMTTTSGMPFTLNPFCASPPSKTRKRNRKSNVKVEESNADLDWLTVFGRESRTTSNLCQTSWLLVSSSKNIMKIQTSISKTNTLIDFYHQQAEKAGGQGLAPCYVIPINPIFCCKMRSSMALI